MFAIRRSHERGHANHGWLDSYHTFSFADYHDPKFMGFRSLRVINEDVIAEGEGFGTHPHRDMEIITYMLEGELAHKDSMGNGRVIKAGEIQGMSAGTGVTHSEFNASKFDPAHLLQIWIMPHTKSVSPSYAEWKPDGSEAKGWQLVASEGGKEGGVPIHQDARLFITKMEANESRDVQLAEGRYGWLQVARGEIGFAGEVLTAGDGAMFDSEAAGALKAVLPSEVLFFDLQ